MFKQTSPENAATISALAGLLEQTPIGATIAYQAMEKAGFRHDGDYWLLASARERVEKNLGCAFESVRGVGIKRLTSSEIPDVGLVSLRKIRRAANRGKKRLDRVNTNSLSMSEQRRVIGMSAMLGAVSMLADGRKASAIATVADPVRPIPPKNILEMFRTD